MTNNLTIRAVVQRAQNAEVTVDAISQGKIPSGLVILLGIGLKDIRQEIPETAIATVLQACTPQLEKLADKLLSLRIFSDAAGKMNLSIRDISGGIYVISQFTLFADCSKGNRPSFTASAKPYLAKPLYELFLAILKQKATGLVVCSGVFGADMQVSFCNDGPVTLILDF